MRCSLWIEVETVGEKEHGIGTTRYITIGFFKVKERLESINPPDGFNYKLLSGAPIRNYLGTVKILPKEFRSEIQWKVRFDPKIPYTGWLCGVICKSTINRLRHRWKGYVTSLIWMVVM